MTTNFNSLQSNFSEILSTLHTDKQPTLPLVVSSHTTVQCTYCLWGQVVKLWNMIPFGAPAPSLEHTLQSIMTCFDKGVLQVLESRKKKMEHYTYQIGKLNIRLQKSTEFDLRAHRHLVVNFQQATEQLWQIFTSDIESDISLRAPIIQYVNKDCLLYDRRAQKQVAKECAWVLCEGMTQMEIPISLLLKIHHLFEFTTLEKRKFDSWIQAVNEMEMFPVASFRFILSDVVEIINKEEPSFTMKDLLNGLDKNGCLLLNREDEEQLDFRDRLVRGHTVECNGVPLIIGSELGEKRVIKNRYRVFEVENDCSLVVKIPDNRFRCFLQNQPPVFRVAKTIRNLKVKGYAPISGIDHEGRCVITEKLIPLFNESPWTSKDYRLCAKDEKLALIFANHLLYYQYAKIVPSDLSVNHLYMTQDGILKSTRIITRSPQCYNKWEEFCVNLSQKNLYVLSFLMNVSRISHHPIALFYRKVVSETLELGEDELLGERLPSGHSKKKYRTHAKQLCEQAKQMREECIAKVEYEMRQQGKKIVKIRLHIDVGMKMAQEYCTSSTPGILSASIVDSVVDSYKEKIKQEGTFGLESYYKSHYETVSKRERDSNRQYVETLEEMIQSHGWNERKEQKSKG